MHSKKDKKLKAFSSFFIIIVATTIAAYQPVSGKGLEDDFIGKKYLLTSWVKTISVELVGSPILADLDRDGYKEILISSPHRQFCINSDGSLRWVTNVQSTLIGMITVADLDEDGRSDIIVTGKSSIICFDSYGEQIWEYHTDYELEEFLPCIFDFNNDHHLEILISTAKTPSQPFLLNHNGEYIKHLDIEAHYSGFWSNTFGGSPTVADLENDGELEILMLGNDYKIHCLSIQGVQKWVADPIMRGDVYFSIADLDGDNNLEICVGNILRLYCFDHEGNISWIYEKEPPGRSSILMDYDPCIADVDNDGMLNIVSSSYDWETGGGQVFCLNSTGGEMWNFNSTTKVGSPALIDIDNDNKLEILFSEGEENLGILNSDGNLIVYRDLNTMLVEPPLVADIDLDSQLEIIIVRPPQEDIYCFEIRGSTNSTGSWWSYGGTYLHHGRPDSDGDSLDDLIETNYYLTDMYSNDTDNDLLPDNWEVEYGLNPLDNNTFQDPDKDKISNFEEYSAATNPRIFNNWKLLYGTYFLPLWIFIGLLIVVFVVKFKAISAAVKGVFSDIYIYIRVKFAKDIRSSKEVFHDDLEISFDFEEELMNEK